MIIFILLFTVSVFATTSPETAIEEYYSAAESEDLERYFEVLAVGEMLAEEITFEKKIVELAWNSVENQSHEITNLEKVIDEEGENALLRYNLTAAYTNSVTNEETTLEEVPHIALALKEGGNWKIVYAVVLADYLDMKENAEQLEAIESEVQKFVGVGDAKAPLYIDNKKYVPGKEIETQGGLKQGILNLIDLLIGLIAIMIFVIFCVLVLLIIIGLVKKPKGKKIAKEKKEETRETQKVEEKTVSVPTKEKKKTEKSTKTETANATKKRSDAMKILRERYAKGEITKKEYEEMKLELGD